MMALAPAAVATPPVMPSAGADDAQPYTVAVLRLLIKNSKAGLLIGKGGAGIRTISDATGAKLYVHDLPPGCTERVLMVHAREIEDSVDSPARAAFMKIHEQLLSHEGVEAAANGGMHTTRMLVAGEQASEVFGDDRVTLNALQAQSATLINLQDAPPCAMPEDKVLEIIGPATAVKNAVALISDLLRKFGVDRSVLPFFEFTKASTMPAQQPPLPANAYGMYGEDHYALAAAQGVLPHHAGAHAGMGVGYGGDAASDAYRHSNAHVGPHAYDPYAGYAPAHPAQAAAPAPVPVPMPAAAASASAVPAISVQMRVMQGQIGSVLGVNNANLQQIRSMSGATVSVFPVAGPAGEHIVEIQGDNNQVQAAQALTNAFMISPGAAQGPAVGPSAPQPEFAAEPHMPVPHMPVPHAAPHPGPYGAFGVPQPHPGDPYAAYGYGAVPHPGYPGYY